jgi:hypothetical protein
MDSNQDSPNGEAENQADQRRASRLWLLLLLLPYVGLLYPPIYARFEPELLGMPFFIWYQFLWVFITVAITTLVYRVRG